MYNENAYYYYFREMFSVLDSENQYEIIIFKIIMNFFILKIGFVRLYYWVQNCTCTYYSEIFLYTMKMSYCNIQFEKFCFIFVNPLLMTLKLYIN